jgi:hypothetical protein
MRIRALFIAAKLPVAALAAVVLTLAGCLITTETAGRSRLLYFGSLSLDNGRGIIVLPEVPQYYGSIRIAASSYPARVYRVVIVYRDGREVSYHVGWRFTDRIRYHDLRVRNDRGIREVRIYQSPERSHRGPAGRASFRIYGLQ